MSEKRTTRNFGWVYRVRGEACIYCGGVANSVDHVLPWSYRPDNSKDNLVPACMECNGIASNLIFQTLDEKVRYVVRVRQRRRLPVYLNYYDDELEDGRSVPEPESVEHVSALHPSGISDEQFADAYGDGVVSAEWESIVESEPAAVLESDLNDEDTYLCGKPTKKGRPCKIPRGECQIHNEGEDPSAPQGSKVITRSCLKCDQDFDTYERFQTWCDECENEPELEITCPVCGLGFTAYPSDDDLKKIYCSDKCMRKDRVNLKGNERSKN